MHDTSIRSTPRRRRPGARLMAVTACLGLLALSCGKDDDTPEQDGAAPGDTTVSAESAGMGTISGPADGTEVVDGGKVLFGIEAEPAGLDPTRFAFSSAGHLVASAVFDPLATIDENGNAVPYLAETLEPNADNTSWTISIPEGVTFHDGSILDAPVVAKNLEAHRVSAITSAAFKAVSAVEVLDEYTVRVDLSIPYARFPLLLTAQAGYIVSPDMLNDGALSLEPIGTGPFKFENHVADQRWSFTRNDGYWRQGLPHLGGIEFLPITDNGERLSNLEDGSVDIVYTQRPEQVQQLRQSDYKLVEYGAGDESILVLNTSKPPFDNKLARQAVAYATDSAAYRETRTQGVETPANGPFAPGQPGYLEENGYPSFDLAKAKALVEQYEAETGQPLAFSWTTQEDVDNLADVEFLRPAYEEAGMEVTVTAIPQVNLVATVATGAYEMARFRLFNQPDPDADSHFWRTSSIGDLVSLNFPRYQNPEADAAIDRALAATELADRDAAYQELNRILAADVPFIWLGRSVWVLAADPSVNGIYAAKNGSLQTVGPKTWIAELWISR